MKNKIMISLQAFSGAAILVASSANAIVRPYHMGKNGKPQSKTADATLYYFGGPVISKAAVVTVFWGTKDIDPNLVKELPTFYKSMVNSTYMDWLKQYNTNVHAVDGRMGTNQSIGRGTYAGTVTIVPSNTKLVLSEEEIQAELKKQIDEGKLPKNTKDTVYMIHFPKGLTITIPDGNGGTASSCRHFCAFHGGVKDSKGGDIFYGVMPDLRAYGCSSGCGMGLTTFQATTVCASHELIEAVTDGYPTPGTNPAYPQAWNTKGGEEISDICNGKNAKLIAGTKTYVVTHNRDNLKNGCTTASYTSSENPTRIKKQ